MDDVPSRPRRQVAPSTHPDELQRLALQEQAHPDCDPLHAQTIVWIFRAFNAVSNAQAEELRAIGLSPSGFNALMALHNTPTQVLEPRHIAERLLISRASVTGLLDTLEQRNLVRRRPHPDDGRRVLVSLTAKARRTLGRHFATHYARQAEILGDLARDELGELVRLLRKVRGATPLHLQQDPTEASA
jgi:DNA-binding MarR family transcriptional regulator